MTRCIPPGRLCLAAMVVLALSGCGRKQEAALPTPQEITATSTAEFCGMALQEHPGPKGQIFVRNRPAPYWFASVRDTVAFTMMPEMPHDIVVVYVNDMGRARDWDQPEAGAWVDARKAVFVIGSARRSGMNSDEAVPFGDAGAAARFAAREGGRVVSISEMPPDYIFGGGNGS
jgi:copper chaperone NosL